MTAQAESAAPAPPRQEQRTSWIDTIVRAREVSLIGVLALLVLAVSLAEPRFLNAQNLRDILLNVSIVALLAVGQTIVVVTRNIDLSVGSVLGITAFLTGVLFADHGWPIPLVFVAGMLFGGFFGLMNGVMVAWARVPSLVITLGTLYVIRGIDFAWAHGRQINAADMPKGFLNLATHTILGFPVLPLFTIAAMVIVGVALARSRMGRELYAIGSNPDAAVLAGIRVSRRVLGAFVASGAIAGLAGVLYASRYGTLDANAGNGIELAAVVRGGRRRRRHLRRLRHRLRRRARRPAAGHDPQRARDPADQPLLGAGHQRRAAAAGDRPRRLPRAPVGPRTAQAGLAPCLSSSTSSRAGRPSPSSC